LGFAEEAQIYRKLLTDANNSGIKAVARPVAAKTTANTVPTVNSKKQSVTTK